MSSSCIWIFIDNKFLIPITLCGLVCYFKAHSLFFSYFNNSNFYIIFQECMNKVKAYKHIIPVLIEDSLFKYFSKAFTKLLF